VRPARAALVHHDLLRHRVVLVHEVLPETSIRAEDQNLESERQGIRIKINEIAQLINQDREGKNSYLTTE
jgi:hypothetical protein